MVLIPVGMNYRVTVTGQVPKLVRCEGCGYEYVYPLESSATGHGSRLLFLDNQGAKNEARETAQAAVGRKNTSRSLRSRRREHSENSTTFANTIRRLRTDRRTIQLLGASRSDEPV